MVDKVIRAPRDVANAKVYAFRESVRGGEVCALVLKVYNDDNQINSLLRANGLAPSDGFEQVAVSPARGASQYEYRYAGRSVHGWDAHLAWFNGCAAPDANPRGVSLMVTTRDGQSVEVVLDVTQVDRGNLASMTGKPGFDGLPASAQSLADPW